MAINPSGVPAHSRLKLTKLWEQSLEKSCVPSLFIEIISLFQVLSAIALINRCVFVDIYLMLFNRIILLILQIDNYKMSIIYMCIHILIKVHTYLKLLSAVGPQDYKNKDPRQNLESIESQSICKKFNVLKKRTHEKYFLS